MKTPCPHCGETINPAALLGTAGKGKPKTFSAAELARRKKRLAEARKLRWPNNNTNKKTTP